MTCCHLARARRKLVIDLAADGLSLGGYARIELRELAAQPRRGSESAAQLLIIDRPLWRADLFDRLTERTHDVQDAVRLMISQLRCPDLLDTGRVSPWAAVA